MSNFADILKEEAKSFGLELNDEKINRFLLYKDLLLEWNNKLNLTAIKDPKEILIKHFLDSITIIKYIKIEADKKLIDIGTGAGFPGVPIKIYEPSLQIVLLDSLNKRIKFLEDIREKLNLTNMELVHGRAEEYGVKNEYRENYDFAVSRAVSKLSVLAEYCLPFVKVNGYFISYKGPNIEEEIKSAVNPINNLGGKIKEIVQIKLPIVDGTRNLIIIQKLRNTPTKFPRKPGTPEKKPLE